MTKYLKTDFDINSKELVELIDELPIWSAPFGLKLLDGIDYRKGITALDIGFGTGFPLTEIAMRLGSSSRVIGIDPWDAAIERVKRKIKLYGIQNIEIIQGVAENISLHDNAVDLIVSNNGLNNVSDINKSLSECARITKQGGQFIQTMNLNDSMVEFYSVMEKVLVETGLEFCLEEMRKQIYKKRKPLDEYLGLIKAHGFSVDGVLHDAFEYKFVDGSAMFNHYFIRLAFLDGWKEIVPLERQEEVFEMIEDNLNEQSLENGICKLSIPFVLIDCRMH